MLQYIKQFQSGFYGLYWASDNTLIDGALIEWDGKKGTSYSYNVNNNSFDYYITAENTVYYTDKSGNNARIWCGGARLNVHCKHLQAIAAR